MLNSLFSRVKSNRCIAPTKKVLFILSHPILCSKMTFFFSAFHGVSLFHFKAFGRICRFWKPLFSTDKNVSFVRGFFFSFVGNFYDAPHGFNLIALNASPVEKKSEAEFFAIQMQLIFSSIQNDYAIACISILFSSFRSWIFFSLLRSTAVNRGF